MSMSLQRSRLQLYRDLLELIQQLEQGFHVESAPQDCLPREGEIEASGTIAPAQPPLTPQQSFELMQKVFQTQILAQDWQELENQTWQFINSVNVEISKQLRLLKTDLIFLATARQTETLQKRRSQICDRLRLLAQYCQAILSQAIG
ncbi:MAG: heterocyst frequency control protein PatD [Synechococcales bacterium]|nr:heterocyst frequency control protein PatD [Synechococcales bacterium]